MILSSDIVKPIKLAENEHQKTHEDTIFPRGTIIAWWYRVRFCGGMEPSKNLNLTQF